MANSVLLCVLGVLLCASSTYCTLSSEQVVSRVKAATAEVKELQAKAEKLAQLDVTLYASGKGKFLDLLVHLEAIKKICVTLKIDLQGSAVANGADADKVYESFKEFSTALQRLLQILKAKIASLNITAQIKTALGLALKGIKEAIEDLVSVLIIVCPTAAAKFLAEKVLLINVFIEVCGLLGVAVVALVGRRLSFI